MLVFSAEFIKCDSKDMYNVKNVQINAAPEKKIYHGFLKNNKQQN